MRCSALGSRGAPYNMMDTAAPIVLDIGSRRSKVGFAGDDAPKVVLSSVTDLPLTPTELSHKIDGCLFEGFKTKRRHSGILVRQPIERGIVWNWGELEMIWKQIFDDELKVHQANHPILLTETSFCPEKQREQIAEIMFETFGVPAVYMANQDRLSLLSISRSTGLVLDSGDSVTTAVAVYEGHHLPNSIKRLELGGSDLTEYLTQKVQDKGYDCSSAYDRECIRGMKEKVCFVTRDFDACSTKPEEIYELPNDQVINVNEERFSVPECLFRPLNDDHVGFHEAIYDAINKCDVDIHSDLYANIVLSGGNTLFPGMADRLQKEITNLAPPHQEIHIIAPPKREHSAWIGGSILASQSTSQQMWVTRAEYDEHGPSIVHQKCL